jgi:TRAP-type C4-dicarboxylate transport system substrate-binding protein
MIALRKAFTWTILSAGAIAFVGVASAAEKFNFSFGNAATSHPNQTNLKFVELVKERTKGQIDIIIHAGSSLGYKERESYLAVRDGAVEMGGSPFDKLIGLQPVYELQSLPFLTPTIESTKAMWEAALPWYEEAFKKDNMILVFGAPFTPQGIWEKIKVRTPEDLKGRKIRTYDVTGLKVLKAAGAAPIQMSMADVVPALSSNVITGILTSDDSGCDLKVWEYGVKYFNSLGYTMGISAGYLNAAKFKALSPEFQKIIVDSGKEATEWGFKNSYAKVEKNKQMMKDGGAEYISDVPQVVIDHLKKAGDPLLGEWKKKMGPDADKILAAFAAKMKK